MTDSITEDDRQAIINDLRNDAGSQQEIADKHGVSQSTVSNINQGLSAGRQDGYKEAVKDTYSFPDKDETETSDDDVWTCGYCDGEVEVVYLADECPNGHDLTDDWDQ